MAKKIVILGAGYAGVTAALHLNRRGKRDNIEITVIDRNPYHTLLTEIHEVAGNRQDAECMRIPLKEIFRDTKVRVVTDEIDGFDFEGKRLVGQKGEYTYDYCIVAVGSKPAFYGIEGLERNAFTLWSLDDAVKIRSHIRECFEKAAVMEGQAERRRLLTFVVAGAGFTGVEMAGELGHWVKQLCRVHGIARSEVRLVLLDMLSRVLPGLDEKSGEKAHRYMQRKLGIEILLETRMERMDPDRAVTSRGEIPTRTLIWCAGVCCAEGACPIDRIDRSGRFKVDEFCRTEHKSVYTAGDCGGLTGDNLKPYMAMVENAIQTADGAAENILREIRGLEPKKVTVKFHGVMVSVGNFFGVSNIMGRRLPSWLSLLMKYMVNAHYLFEIMGIRGPAKYLRDEVLERRQDKFFLEKHYTKRMQAWWAMPLRMFLGAYWVYEGVSKIAEGWLTSPKLGSFLGMASAGTDAASSATGIAATQPETIFNLDIALIQVLLKNATNVTPDKSLAQNLFAQVNFLHFGDFDLVHWILQHWVLSTQGWEMFFQIVILLAELAVGLMLLGGAFTFLASAASLGLMGLFVTSTGVYASDWWMVFASIATMGGAGRAFGMDHYLEPWYSRVWENFWKNRRLKLFFRRSAGEE